jgi:hypothetical protein
MDMIDTPSLSILSTTTASKTNHEALSADLSNQEPRSARAWEYMPAAAARRNAQLLLPHCGMMIRFLDQTDNACPVMLKTTDPKIATPEFSSWRPGQVGGRIVHRQRVKIFHAMEGEVI